MWIESSTGPCGFKEQLMSPVEVHTGHGPTGGLTGLILTVARKAGLKVVEMVSGNGTAVLSLASIVVSMFIV